tara:strand:+ start:231 stop:341 length:111 start_codon:yes stop_codon:yes gene_type:complete
MQQGVKYGLASSFNYNISLGVIKKVINKVKKTSYGD